MQHRRIMPVLSYAVLVGLALLSNGCQPKPVYYPQHAKVGHVGRSSGITPAGPSVSWSLTSNPPTASQSQLLSLLNARRNALGYRSLVWHDGLAAVAQAHSTDMVNNNYLNLTSPAGYDVFEQLVNANPPMSFNNAFAFVSEGPAPANWPTELPIYLSNPAIAAGLLNPAMTQFGQVGVLDSAGMYKHTFILGQDVTP